MGRKKRHGGDDHGGGGGGGHGGASGRWLVSYADFITLMFVVFTVLFSMARLDVEKAAALSASFRSAMGPAGPDLAPFPTRGVTGQAVPLMPPERPGSLPDVPDWPAQLIAPVVDPRAVVDPPPPTPPPKDAKPSTNPKDPTSVPPAAPPVKVDELKGLEDALRTLPGFRSGLLAVAMEQSGLRLSIAGNLLFQPGQAELKPEARAILDEVIPQLAIAERPIWIYGTADVQAVAGAPEPEYLAGARSASVAIYFRNRGIPSDNLVSISHAANASNQVVIVVQRRNQ